MSPLAVIGPVDLGERVKNMYDPYREAERLEVEVVVEEDLYERLRVSGHYVDVEHRIYLQAGQPARQERCTLAHELVHAEKRDAPLTDLWEHRRRERSTDRAAARRLIDVADLAEALIAHGGRPRLVAIDLNVTERMLEHRIAGLHPAEEHRMRELARDEGDAESA